MKARAFILACGAATLILPFACANAAPSDVDDAPLVLQAGPRIIHVPEPPKHEPKRHIERPPRPPEPRPHVELPPRQSEAAKPTPPKEAAKPILPQEAAKPPAPPQLLAPPEAGIPAHPQAPAGPTFRRPAPTKSNRKIWI